MRMERIVGDITYLRLNNHLTRVSPVKEAKKDMSSVDRDAKAFSAGGKGYFFANPVNPTLAAALRRSYLCGHL